MFVCILETKYLFCKDNSVAGCVGELHYLFACFFMYAFIFLGAILKNMRIFIKIYHFF